MRIETLLLLLILGVISTIGYFIKDLPNLYRELRVEEFRGKNEKDIQREAYFRQIKGTDLDSTFAWWTELIVDMDNKTKYISTPAGLKEFAKLQQKVLMYGSEDTVAILSIMMQAIYQNGTIENKVSVNMGVQDDTKAKTQSYKLMYYISYLISSLKKDFTGYRIEPSTILRITIKDIDTNKNKNLFNDAYEFVKKELEDSGVNY